MLKFAVFHSSTEYHATKEIPFAYHSSARGKVKGVSLNSLCGAYIGSVPYRGGVYDNGEPMTRLYDEPPAGLELCKTCEHLMNRRSGWLRVISHFFHRWGSFRAASKF